MNNSQDPFVDFLVVGAAKSGTTALHEILKQQPGLCLPGVKETNFFALTGEKVDFRGPLDDCTINRFSITDWEEYQAQFAASSTDLKGEVCPLYLYSPKAPQEIARRVPNARIIIVLRNPVDRAYSNYLHLVRDGRETLSFAGALEKEEERIAMNWEWFWHIKRQGYYSAQVQRYLDTFPAHQVKIFIYEHFFSETQNGLREMLEFIGLDGKDVGPVSAKYNVSGRPVNWIRPIYGLLLRPGLFNHSLRAILPARLRKNLSGVFKRLVTRREFLEESARTKLYQEYARDIDALEGIIGQSLDVWRPTTAKDERS
jgi:hypothetical protein